MPPILQARGLSLSQGDQLLFDAIDLSIESGDRLCLVGRNGAGKSTLFAVIAGRLAPDGGSLFVQPGTRIVRLAQEVATDGFATVGALVGNGVAEHRARAMMAALEVDAAADPARLSGGEARRAALARALAADADLLLLDEPTNHLDLPAIMWLERELAGRSAAVVVISHDRRFLETVGRGCLWLDRGRLRRLDQGFAGFEAWRDEQLDAEALARHKLDRRIAREEDWVRYGVTARRTRNQGRMARLADLRAERRAARGPARMAGLAATEAGQSGSLVVEAEGVTHGFGGAPIIADLSLTLRRGDRLGVVGPNGAGKTTLLRLLTGELAPDAGRIKLGASLAVAWLDQRRQTLDPRLSLADTLTGGQGETVRVGDRTRHVVGHMKDFLFRAEQAPTPVGDLSGGERGRLMLAIAFARPSNLLVLDEPTNDLDLETLDLLQEAVADYAGTVVAVSHDRDFLDRVATSVVVAEGRGLWREYAGGYADMLAQRGAAPAAIQKPASAPSPRSDARPAPSTPRAKLSYGVQRELDQLPARIAGLEAEIKLLERRVADSGAAATPKLMAELTATLALRLAERTVAEERWLELELLREAAEAGRLAG
jgi:ATP-binding cassette subfamily F protein uup